MFLYASPPCYGFEQEHGMDKYNNYTHDFDKHVCSKQQSGTFILTTVSVPGLQEQKPRYVRAMF